MISWDHVLNCLGYVCILLFMFMFIFLQFSFQFTCVRCFSFVSCFRVVLGSMCEGCHDC